MVLFKRGTTPLNACSDGGGGYGIGVCVVYKMSTAMIDSDIDHLEGVLKKCDSKEGKSDAKLMENLKEAEDLVSSTHSLLITPSPLPLPLPLPHEPLALVIRCRITNCASGGGAVW